jgi:hypothetical protein
MGRKEMVEKCKLYSNNYFDYYYNYVSVAHKIYPSAICTQTANRPAQMYT